MPEIWDRQLNEDSKYYHAFTDYLYKTEDWNRTPATAYLYHMNNCENAHINAVTEVTWTHWSRKWDWKERANAYHEHLLESDRKFYESKARKARREHMQVADYAVHMAAKKLNDMNPEDIPDGQAMTFTEKAIGLRNKILGADKEEKQEVMPNLTIHWHSAPAQISTGELAQLPENLAKNFKVPELEIIDTQVEESIEELKQKQNRWT